MITMQSTSALQGIRNLAVEIKKKPKKQKGTQRWTDGVSIQNKEECSPINHQTQQVYISLAIITTYLLLITYRLIYYPLIITHCLKVLDVGFFFH